MPRLPRRGDDLGVVAIREHRAPAAWTGLALADRGVEVLGGRDLEALHPPRQGLLVEGFDEQVDVRALDADVHDPEVLAPGGGERGLADRAIREPAAQGADRADDPQDHVDRVPCMEVWTGLVRRTGPPALRLAARASPLATTWFEQR